MFTRTGGAGLQRSKQHRAIESLIRTLALQQRLFGMVATAQFTPTGGLDSPIRFAQHRADERNRLFVGPRFVHRLPHYLDRFLHHLSWIKLWILSHALAFDWQSFHLVPIIVL